MAQIIKTIPNELDGDSKYSVRVRSINSFGVSSAWSEALVVDTGSAGLASASRLIITEDGLLAYDDTGKLAFGYYSGNDSRTNEVKNPSFESNITGWVGLPNSTIARSTATYFYGQTGLNASAIVQGTTSNIPDVGIEQAPAHRIPCSANEIMSVSAYVKPNIASRFRVGLRYYSGGGVLIQETLSVQEQSVAASLWTRLTAPALKAPVGTAFAAVVIKAVKPMALAEYYYVDGVLVERTAIIKEYFDGSTSASNTTWTGTANASTSQFLVQTAINQNSPLITGSTIQTNPAVEFVGGMKIDPSGVHAYNPSGTEKVFISALTGDITATDGTFTGSTFRTGLSVGIGLTPGAGVLFNSSGIRGYNGVDVTATFSLTTDGSMTARSGLVGGWGITATTLQNNSVVLDSTGNITVGTGNNVAKLSSNDVNNYRLWIGNSTSSLAPFRVRQDGTLFATGAEISGNLTATTGSIGGWGIGATTLAGGNVILDSNGQIRVGTGNNVVYIDSASVYRIWAGHATATSAPFRVSQTGAMTASAGSVGGVLIANNELYIGSGGFQAGMRAATSPGDIVFYAGSATPATAPFRVTNEGLLVASSGYIGTVDEGWQITPTGFQSTGSASAKIYLESDNAPHNPRIYILNDAATPHAPGFGNTGTPFYVDSLGQFSLKDKLLFDPGNTQTGGLGTLTVVGKVRGAIENYGVQQLDKGQRTPTNAVLTSNIVTLTFGVAHGFAVGDTIINEGFTGIYLPMNGAWRIISAPTNTTLTFALTNTNIASGNPGGTARTRVREMTLGVHPEMVSPDGGVISPAGLGMRLDEYNYWFLNNQFRVGTANTYMWYDGGNLTVKGQILADGGQFLGYVTAGTARIGANVSGTLDGLWMNTDNYWYDTGAFKVGGSTQYMQWNGSVLAITGTLTAGNAKFGVDVNGTNDGMWINADNYWYDTGNAFKVGGADQFIQWNGASLTIAGTLVGGLVQSANYDAEDTGTPVVWFSDAGTKIDLTTGNIITPGFFVLGATGQIYARALVLADEENDIVARVTSDPTISMPGGTAGNAFELVHGEGGASYITWTKESPVSGKFPTLQFGTPLAVTDTYDTTSYANIALTRASDSPDILGKTTADVSTYLSYQMPVPMGNIDDSRLIYSSHYNWYINLPGTAGNYIRWDPGPVIQGNMALGGTQIAHDISVKLNIYLPDWTPGTAIVLASQWNEATNQRVWQVGINTDGTVFFKMSSDGINTTQTWTSDLPLPNVPFGQVDTGWRQLWVTYVGRNFQYGWNTSIMMNAYVGDIFSSSPPFSQSLFNGGGVKTLPTPTTMFYTQEPIYIGGLNRGTTNMWAGRINQFSIQKDGAFWLEFQARNILDNEPTTLVPFRSHRYPLSTGIFTKDPPIPVTLHKTGSPQLTVFTQQDFKSASLKVETDPYLGSYARLETVGRQTDPRGSLVINSGLDRSTSITTNQTLNPDTSRFITTITSQVDRPQREGFYTGVTEMRAEVDDWAQGATPFVPDGLALVKAKVSRALGSVPTQYSSVEIRADSGLIDMYSSELKWNGSPLGAWNSAWGIVGYGFFNITNGQLVNGQPAGPTQVAEVSFEFKADRRYRLLFSLNAIRPEVGTTYGAFQLSYDGGGVGGPGHWRVADTTYQATGVLEWGISGLSVGNHTVKVWWAPQSAGNTFLHHDGGLIEIWDAGPLNPGSTLTPVVQQATANIGNSMGIVVNIGNPNALVNAATGVGVDISNSGSTFLAAGRRYRIVYQCRALTPGGASGGTYGGRVRLYVDGVNTEGTLGDRYYQSTWASGYDNLYAEWIMDGDDVLHNFKVNYIGDTMVIHVDKGIFYVEDVGPNVTPALPVSSQGPSWTNLTFSGGWSNYNQGWMPGQFRKIGDVVTVRGLVKCSNGTDTIIARLPGGYRPTANHYFNGFISWNNTAGRAVVRMDVDPNGYITMAFGYGFPTGTNPTPTVVDHVSLNDISFSTTPE